MTRYICTTEKEFAYIVKKYNLKYSRWGYDNILNMIMVDNFVSLKIDTPTIYCKSLCVNCKIKNCKYIATDIIYVSNIMREEKLKNILDENF
jgi:hypothetical protein